MHMYYLYSIGNYHSKFDFTEQKYLLPLKAMEWGLNGLKTSFVCETFLFDSSFHLLNN